MPEPRDRRQHRDDAVGARAFRLQKRFLEFGFDQRTHPEDVLAQMLDSGRSLHRAIQLRAERGDQLGIQLVGDTPGDTLNNLHHWLWDPPSTFSDLLARYARCERYFVGSELDNDENNDLTGKCLDDSNFATSFVVARFNQGSLRRVCFYEANLKTCDFTEADLTGANFRRASLDATRFGGANLYLADFTGATCYSRTLTKGEMPDW